MEPILTIRNAFGQGLPKVLWADEGYRVVKSNAASTISQDPIRAFILDQPEGLLRDVSRTLEGSSRNPERLERPMPQHESGHNLKTESDILRLSALQLIHPINIVLSGLIPSKAQLFCQSEVVSQGGKARTDLKWVYSEGGRETVVAVLEYKNTRAIRYSDFEEAITTREQAADALRDARGKPMETHLENNAIVLSQQIKKYTDDCDDVALFDWHSMFIFDFSNTDENARRPELPRGIFSEKSTQFRPLLLGMIVRSLARHGFI